ncbi:fucose-specific lectin [Echria macrotheca]|uniref:Fucose-specific lectin n=1 Tax=Echria macrotheca TaxID=438768 RepID=A0AAJ0BDB1_9PEZI|nr:fucose-specific lectin [Echria macrotheca]
MSGVNEIQIRSAVAAVRKDSHLRVYETAVDGGIREAQFEGSWTGGTARNVIATGKIGTPVAATSLGLEHIRVYYVSPKNQLGEAAYESGSGWYDGNLSSAGFSVAPYSSVAAVYLGGKSVLRVYAQLANDTIQEWVWNSDGKGWSAGSNLGSALPGTQIAATSWGTSSIHIRVYAQDANLNIFEKGWDGNGWYTGGLNFSNKVTRAALGATSWGEGNSLGIRLYYGATGDLIKEKAWDGSGGWYDGGFSQSSIPASSVAAIPLDVLRVYLQNGTKNTAFTEFAWGSSGWSVGRAALPPA